MGAGRVSERCITGSWPGQSQCENEAVDDTFCLTCWMAIHGMGPECDCAGCLEYLGEVAS